MIEVCARTGRHKPERMISIAQAMLTSRSGAEFKSVLLRHAKFFRIANPSPAQTGSFTGKAGRKCRCAESLISHYATLHGELAVPVKKLQPLLSRALRSPDHHVQPLGKMQQRRPFRSCYSVGSRHRVFLEFGFRAL